MKRLEQIMPAIGWVAIFLDKNESGEDIYVGVPLVAWGLFVEFEYADVMGLTCGKYVDIEPVEEDGRFKGYIRDGEDPNDVIPCQVERMPFVSRSLSGSRSWKAIKVKEDDV